VGSRAGLDDVEERLFLTLLELKLLTPRSASHYTYCAAPDPHLGNVISLIRCLLLI
jgi:hypothetical protein